jgi:hypothetical protein
LVATSQVLQDPATQIVPPLQPLSLLVSQA